ncbi:DUF554 family protein [Paenibacillus sp. E222]|uniref:DUF554 family protein n=1 Tax=Paenibacillus sp. E222 TaxID=2748863 RepID=UPI0015C649A6|nr:DUF554 family protein [Paenibacillus sp. E222]QLG38988.1 DUF554 family protein [Paenibacillus sp. E222]
MLGILINCFYIIRGSTLGAISKRFMNDGYKSILNQVIGISALIIGISEVFQVQPETENKFNLAYDLNQ